MRSESPRRGVCCGAAAATDAGGRLRVDSALDATAELLSAVTLPERGEFCPTTYPIANATANSSTTMKNPLSNCLLPTTSSNSPVSLFRMFMFGCPGFAIASDTIERAL